jgi:hypothetical protein
VIVTVEFEKVTDDVTVTFNRSGQIVAADFPEFRSISEIGTAFVTALVNKDYGLARGFLHPLLKAEVFPAKVQGSWENLLKRTASASDRGNSGQKRFGYGRCGIWCWCRFNLKN